MRCPGQDTRFWGSESIFEIACPKCGENIEFFKDEPTRKCKKCGHSVVNPKIDFGCASYCKYAAECLGDSKKNSMYQENFFKDRVGLEMKRYFKDDFKRIGHAIKVARYAEKIVKKEKGDPAVILSAAYLHDIGIHEAERKYNSTSAIYQEKEGPPIAKEILTKLGASKELIFEVCDIIAHHHHPREKESLNFKILYDSDMLVNLKEKQKSGHLDSNKLDNKINNSFLTSTGRELANSLLKKIKN